MARKNRSGTGTKSGTQTTPVVVHTKRKEIQDEEGWTHIVDAPQRPILAQGRRHRKKNSVPVVQNPLLTGGDFEINGVGYINRTLEEVKKDYEYWRKGWAESDACASLREILGKDAGNRREVKDVVFLGMGSLQSFRREGRRSSATQLAALQTIVDILSLPQNPPRDSTSVPPSEVQSDTPESSNAQSIKVIIQDPQFTKLDKELLEGLGYTVVEDPEAFTAITENTLVYAIHCYSDVYKSVSNGPRPAVLIGTDVDNFGKFNSSVSDDDITKSFEAMVEGCEELSFPQIRHDFSDTKIYWRKNAEAATQTEKSRADAPPAVVESASIEAPAQLEDSKDADTLTSVEIRSEVIGDVASLKIEDVPAAATSTPEESPKETILDTTEITKAEQFPSSEVPAVSEEVVPVERAEPSM